MVALLALSGVALATDFAPSQTGDSQAGFGGFDVQLGEDSWLQATGVDYDVVTGLELTGITLDIHATWYTMRNMTTGFGIGIYEKTGANTWSLVGKTDWFSHTASSYEGTHEFHVAEGTSVTLETGKTYTLAFHAGQTYFNGLDIGDTRSSMTGATEWKNSTPPTDTSTLAAVGLGVQSGLGNDGATMYQAGSNGTSTDYIPNITLSGNLIPEPTTATLSLLALAGLAARRRRK